MRFVGLHLKLFSLTQCYVGLLFTVCILALVAGCEQAKKPRDTAVVKKKVKDTRVTSAEAKRFAKQYLSAINRQNTRKTQELIDWNAIVDRIFKDLPPDANFQDKYAAGGKRILSKFFKGIRLESSDGGSYSLLKTVLRGKDRHVIFRLVTGSSASGGGGRLNYHNLRLVKRNGKVRADDIYVARNGAWLSESYRNAIRPALLESQRSPVGFTTLQQKEMNSYLLQAGMTKAARTGNYLKASKIYEKLPEDFKKAKSVMTTRLLATERDDFFEAVEAMNTEFPGSPAVGLRLLDFGVLHKDVEILKTASESLEKWTTGDSYIDLNIAALLFKLGKIDEADKLSREIDVREFDFRYPIFLKFNIALAAKDNATILECFRIFRDVYDDNIKQVLESDACKDFVVSLEYVDLKNEGFTRLTTGR